MSVKEVRPDKEFLAKRRRIFGRSMRNALQSQGAEFAGFALVTWDNRGNATSAFYCDTGPIGESLMPTFVHDALNRHVAVVVSQTADTSRVEGDE